MRFFLLILFILCINLGAKQIIGSIDKIDLPLLNLENVNSRIDTGAAYSSLHATNIERIHDKFVKFKVLGKVTRIERISKIQAVRCSNGAAENRYFIRTEVVIFGKTYQSEISLNDRSTMVYSFLVGRDVLKQDFIVDVQAENLSFELKECTED